MFLVSLPLEKNSVLVKDSYMNADGTVGQGLACDYRAILGIEPLFT